VNEILKCRRSIRNGLQEIVEDKNRFN
jgi:hypothetical protein